MLVTANSCSCGAEPSVQSGLGCATVSRKVGLCSIPVSRSHQAAVVLFKIEVF